ncbi:HEAT repeat domain-containing protein [Dulcicalothrix desertica]|nr:HEAT repeat domain-containing protein [Dulcicalothrix desertica]
MDELQIALTDLQNPNTEIKELALDKIGTLKPDNAFDIILPFLNDVDPEVRGTAACNLGYINDSKSIPYLIKLAETDSEEKVRSGALSALGNYKSDEVLRCLLNEVYREKKSRGPRQIVAKQLQNYNNSKSLDTLTFLLLEDEDVYVRIFAADSLFVLNRSGLQSVWKQALEDNCTYVTEVAEKAINNLQEIFKN